MIYDTLYIDGYDWVVHCFLDVGLMDSGRVRACAKEIGAFGRMMRSIDGSLGRSAPNTAFTYSNKSAHESMMVVYHATCQCQMLNSISHEIRHLCDDIADECGVYPSGEEVAYLTGDITMRLCKPIRFLVCDCPKCKKNETKYRKIR